MTRTVFCPYCNIKLPAPDPRDGVTQEMTCTKCSKRFSLECHCHFRTYKTPEPAINRIYTQEDLK